MKVLYKILSNYWFAESVVVSIWSSEEELQQEPLQSWWKSPPINFISSFETLNLLSEWRTWESLFLHKYFSTFPIAVKNTFTKFRVPKIRFHTTSWEVRSEPSAQNATNWCKLECSSQLPMFILRFYYDISAPKSKVSTPVFNHLEQAK